MTLPPPLLKNFPREPTVIGKTSTMLLTFNSADADDDGGSYQCAHDDGQECSDNETDVPVTRC